MFILLLGTVSREIAQDLKFGRKRCFEIDDLDDTDYTDDNECKDFDEERE